MTNDEELIEASEEVGHELETGHPHTNEGLGDTTAEMIRQRILHVLSIYPKLSPSMLQVGIGTGMPPTLWRPILEQLVKDGAVDRYQLSATHPVSKRDQ